MDWIAAEIARWSVLDALGALASSIALFGLPWGLFIYARDVKRQRRERDVAIYSTLDDKYLHYLGLCLEHPNLNLYVYPLSSAGPYSEAETVQRYAMFETVIAITERAYLRYHEDKSTRRLQQWAGWQGYLKDWKCHPDFRQLWSRLGNQFDPNFVAFVNELAPSNPPPAPISATPKTT